MAPILVTGATGNVGRAVLRALTANGAETESPGGRAGPLNERTTTVAFDFTDPGTWSATFEGVESMFPMRPPVIGNIRRDLLPAVAAARNAGVRHVVFLSLQGRRRTRSCRTLPWSPRQHLSGPAGTSRPLVCTATRSRSIWRVSDQEHDHHRSRRHLLHGETAPNPRRGSDRTQALITHHLGWRTCWPHTTSFDAGATAPSRSS